MLKPLIEPFSVVIGGPTGIKPYKVKLVRRLSDLQDFFYNKKIVEEKLSKGENPTVYEVYEVPQKPVSRHLSLAATIIFPGKVGDEYYFTKGHFHEKEDASEVYIGLEGEGIILMQSRSGEVRHLKIEPNVAVYIPPGFAHRTINVGSSKLVFLAIYPSDAGHDYGSIVETGFAKLVLEREGRPVVVDNPTA
ncbi:MAG: glucose-6-phosphate isomerase [Candidatus Bathyarchaeota archaeon B26-2]|nr:MAG: glucose-6-phosphate isomerase [Candidatus Bathyarchaeota archaeon B26-2]